MSWLFITAGSDRGCLRPGNEDGVLAAGVIERDGYVDLALDTEAMFFRRYGLLVAVADGLGGHQGGEIASQLLLERLAAGAVRLPIAAGAAATAAAIAQLVQAAHAELLHQGELNPDLAGMGSTLAGVLLSGQHQVCFHLGDSRVYRWREGALNQMTIDHAGPVPGVVTRCAGGGPGARCEPEVQEFSLLPGDSLLLCSDGLPAALGRPEIVEVLQQAASPGQAVRQLIAAARERGAPDNVSVALVAWERGEAQHE